MHLNEYQNKATQFKYFDPKLDQELLYFSCGLGGETGEILEEIKKCIRDDNGKITFRRKEGIISEMGDVMWYLSQLAKCCNITLEEIAEYSFEKLEKKIKRNGLSK